MRGGNANADFLAVWDGVSWKPFCNATGPAFGGSVQALQIIGSTLYVGGSFENGAGIPSADYLLACDLNTGAPRSTVLHDGDISGGVYALTADSNGVMYAAGQFINMATIPAADHVASFAGGVWRAMGSGPGPDAGALTGYARSLTAKGDKRPCRHRLHRHRGHPTGRSRREVERLGLERPGLEHRRRGRVVPGLDLHLRADDLGLTRVRRGVVPERERQPDFPPTTCAYFDGSAWHPVGSNGAGNLSVDRLRLRSRHLRQAAHRRRKLHQRRRGHPGALRRLVRAGWSSRGVRGGASPGLCGGGARVRGQRPRFDSSGRAQTSSGVPDGAGVRS